MSTIGLSMIVKEGEATIRACLESVRGIVDQIVIADTGSTDKSREIAREMGATVISVPWENHFAKARNSALELIDTEWVLVLDADEELDRQQAREFLPELLQLSKAGGYLVPICNYIPTRVGRAGERVAVANDGRHPRARGAPAYFAHENCRLFRRHPEIYFTGRIHELVEPQIVALGLNLLRANFCVHHFGYLDALEERRKKDLLYRDLLRLKVEEQPNDPNNWIWFGLQEYEKFNNPEEALRCFERALVLDPHATKAWVFTGMVNLTAGRDREALVALELANPDGESAALREHLRGDALHNLGLLKEARLAYRKAIKLTGSDPLLESKLGYTEVRLGHKQPGIAKLVRAAAAMPDVSEIHERLIKAYIVAGMLAEAAEAADKLTSLFASPETFLRAASIRAQLEQWQHTEDLLSAGL